MTDTEILDKLDRILTDETTIKLFEEDGSVLLLVCRNRTQDCYINGTLRGALVAFLEDGV